MNIKIQFLFIILTIASLAKSQQITISGYVEEESTGERIIGAYVMERNSNTVTSTNDYGYFNLKVTGSLTSIQATFVGSVSPVYSLSLTHDTVFILKINTLKELSEVVVNGSQYNQSTRAPLGLTVIPVKTLTSMPALGEPDLIKSIQNQAGIKGGVEGSAGIFVRGGGGGENLFMIDDVPIYNVSHLYGFFSAFNSNAIKDVKLLKGCFPARYGGRVSSVIDVRSLDGNNQAIQGVASVGLLSSQFTLQGPLFKGKTTFMVSARRSYFDLLERPLKNRGTLNSNWPIYYFYDMNVRLAHTFSANDRLFVSFYKGNDHMQNADITNDNQGSDETFSEKKEETSGWGNTVSSLRWNHVFGSSLFVNTTLAYSTYNYFTQTQYNYLNTKLLTNEIIKRDYFAKYASDITDVMAKTDFDYSLNNRQTFRFGIGNTFHTFNPGENKYNVSDQQLNEYSDTVYANELLKAHEPFCYIEDNIQLTQNLLVNLGVRLTGLIDETGKQMNFEPRFSSSYLITPNLAVKTGYSRMNQYMHLLSSHSVSMPTDIWVPALKGLKPLQSDQVNLGLTYNWEEKAFFSVEVYQKWLNHTTDLANGASVAADITPWYDKVVQGKGSAKGLELSVEKQQGRMKGNVNYTLSSSDRQFEAINNGQRFPFNYDRLHDLSVSLNYQLTEKWDISALWVFGSGFPVSLPIDKYLPDLGIYDLSTDFGGEVFYYPSRNNYRLPAYHRLDLGVHYKTNNRLGEHLLSFDIFNAYNRKNPIYVYYNSWNPRTLKYGSFLPFLPSITYTLKF